MVTAVSGYLGGVPAMWIIVASAVVFAMSAHGLLRANELAHRMTVEGKLNYLNPFFAVECEWNQEGKPTHVAKVNVGLTVANRAIFPIEFVITTITAVVNDRIADASKLEGRVASIAAGLGAVSHPDAIELGDLNTLDLKGRLDFEIKYGKAGNKKYTLKKKLEFELTVHPDQSQKPNPNVGVAVRDRVPQSSIVVQS